MLGICIFYLYIYFVSIFNGMTLYFFTLSVHYLSESDMSIICFPVSQSSLPNCVWQIIKVLKDILKISNKITYMREEHIHVLLFMG